MPVRTPGRLSAYCREALPLLWRESDGAATMEAVRAIVETDKWTSFDRYHDTTRTLMKGFEAAGADAEVYAARTGGPMGSGRWVIQEAQDVAAVTVDVVRPHRERIADYRDNPWHYVKWSTSTPSEGMVNDLAVVDSQEELDRLPRNGLAGKMVLTHLGVYRQVRQWADKGAVGLLIDPPVSGAPGATAWTSFGWGGVSIAAGSARLVGVAIPHETGQKLRGLVKRGGRIVLKTRVDIRRHVGAHDVVSGIVWGAGDPDDEVWAIAHSAEPGAVDNASGVAACLEIARILESLIAAGRLPRPKRTIRLLCGYECYGFFHYLEHAPRGQTPLAGVCIDCVGLEPSRCSRRLEWHATIPMSAGFVDAVGETIVRAALRQHNPGYRCWPRPFVSTSDTLIADPKYGFPCPWLTTYRKGSPGYEGYHSSADTADLLCADGLAVAATAMAGYLHFLADAQSADVAQLATWETERTLARVAAAHKKLSPAQAEFVRCRHRLSTERLTRWMWGGDRAAILLHLADCERRVAEAVAARTSRRTRRTRKTLGLRRVPRRKAPLSPTLENTPAEIADRIRSTKLPAWALFWADGERTLAQIAEAVSCELDQPVDPEQVGRFFEAHQDLGYVDLIEPRHMASKTQLVRDLKALGLRHGMDVMVHSSLSSIGHVKGGPGTVVDALLAAIGKRGTLVMPSFNHSRAEVFNPMATPTTNGAIPDALWRRPEAVRSLHPSHPVAAIGPRAEELTRGHLEVGIWEQDSPIGRLIHSGGYVLSIGLAAEARTAYHVAENAMGCRCVDPFGSQCYIVDGDGRVQAVRGLAWRGERCPVAPSDANAVLDRQGLQAHGTVGHADATLVKAKDLYDVRRKQLRRACPVCKVKPKPYTWPRRGRPRGG